jgi:hypothetical protein
MGISRLIKSLQNGLLRRVLVVFQFCASLILIVGTIIMFKQIKYMINQLSCYESSKTKSGTVS